MSVYASFLKQLGLKKESVRGTAESAPDTWVAVTPDSEMDYSVALLDDPSVRGVMSKYPAVTGLKSGAGSIKFPLRPSDIGEFIHMLMDNPTATEQAAFVVVDTGTGQNNKIDFKEDGGSEKTATLTAGSYAMGTSSATAGTLCAHLKAVLEAAGLGTYTVTYDRTTRKVSIAVATGAAAVSILWKTGTNGSDNLAISSASLLGFTNVDTSSTSPVVSNSTTGYPVFSHAFSPLTATEPQSYTLFMDRGMGVKAYNLCNASSIKIVRAPDAFINFEASLMFKSEAAGSIGSPSFDESDVMTFQHDCVKVGGVGDQLIKNWDINLENGLVPQKTVCGNSADINGLWATEYKANGSFTIYFESETERAKFLAGTSTSLQFTLTGETITGAQTYKLDILFDDIQYTAYPYGVEDNLLAAKVNWRANYDTTNSRLYLLTLTNKKASY